MGLLEAAGERERHVGVQVTFVEFIEHHRAHALEFGIRCHLPEQEGLGHELDARLGGLHAFEANLVTHFTPKPDLAFLRDARGEEAGGDAPRLQDDDLALHEIQVEEHLGDAGRLARPRRSAQDYPAHATAGGDQAVLKGIDGQGLLHVTSRVMRRTLAPPSRTVIRATVTGRLKRRGPALPGLSRSTPPSCSILGTCV